MNVAWPLRFTDAGATATSSDDDHVREMIEQFLFTNPGGERVMRPDFGSGLLQLVFSPNSPELAGALEFTVQAGLQQWLGDIVRVESLEVAAEEATLRIDLRYVVLRTGEERSATIERTVG